MNSHDILVILNLVIIEALLSVDNSTALAAMVQHLPQNQRIKALRYGLLGAYFFRGVCLLAASWLIKIVWLKIAGGLYLMYLAYDFFKKKSESEEEGNKKIAKGFWATIISVEILDLSLSIDNVFAAVALTDNIYLIMGGVAIGILAMRFVAGWFVGLIQKFPSLETSAFIVIVLLGVKLLISGTVHYVPQLTFIESIIENHVFDLVFSATMMAIFFVPLIFKRKTT